MKAVIRLYYIPPFFWLLILLGLKVYFNDLPNKGWDSVLIVLAGALALALFVGTLNYLQETK